MTALTMPPPVTRLWDSYQAFRLAERGNPALLDDPKHIADRQIAHARFKAAYSAWCKA